MAEITKPVQVLSEYKHVLLRCLEQGQASLKRANLKAMNPAIQKALKDELADLELVVRAVNSL